MRHAEFRIGATFTTATGRWRCTDVGTRVIVAIPLDTRGDDWTAGPPYALAEVVFDEADLPGCTPLQDASGTPLAP